MRRASSADCIAKSAMRPKDPARATRARAGSGRNERSRDPAVDEGDRDAAAGRRARGRAARSPSRSAAPAPAGRRRAPARPGPARSKGKAKMRGLGESVRSASSRPAAVVTERPMRQSRPSLCRSARSRLRATPTSPTDTAWIQIPPARSGYAPAAQPAADVAQPAPAGERRGRARRERRRPVRGRAGPGRGAKRCNYPPMARLPGRVQRFKIQGLRVGRKSLQRRGAWSV